MVFADAPHNFSKEQLILFNVSRQACTYPACSLLSPLNISLRDRATRLFAVR
jgi:hypothetical protein